MNIIRGEKTLEAATLGPNKELFFEEVNIASYSLFQEENLQAYQKGLREGEKKGYEAAVQEAKDLVVLLQTLAQRLLEQKKRLLESLKPEIIEFSISICERVIRKELSQPEHLVKLINSLLTVRSPHIQHDFIHIVLAPEDLLMLEKYLYQIEYDKREISGCSFRTDSLIRRGDCRLETQAGILNFSISRELAELAAKVLHS